jgi:hypothetical protein
MDACSLGIFRTGGAVGSEGLDAYRREVEAIFGEELVSLTLYGGDAADDPSDGKGEIHVLLVVRNLRRGALAAYRAATPRFAKRRIPPPPIFTESFLKDSAAVFPLEFLGMKERRKVLSGTDVLASLVVDTANLRHQVEFELKGKLLSLRRMYCSTQGSRGLASLMRRTAGPVAVVARGLLLPSPDGAPHGKREIVAGIESRFGISLPRLREILGAADDASLTKRAEEIFFEYLEEVERICAIAVSGAAGGQR